MRRRRGHLIGRCRTGRVACSLERSRRLEDAAADVAADELVGGLDDSDEDAAMEDFGETPEGLEGSGPPSPRGLRDHRHEANALPVTLRFGVLEGTLELLVRRCCRTRLLGGCSEGPLPLR